MRFLFTADEFICLEDDEEEEETLVGYRSSVKSCLKHLEDAGFSLEFISRLYADFHDEFEDRLYDALKESYNAKEGNKSIGRTFEEAVDELMKPELKQTYLHDVKQFINWLRRKENRKRHETWLDRSISGSVFISSEWIDDQVGHDPWAVPPAVSKVAMLFGESVFVDYPEIAEICICRILLEVSRPTDTVELNGREIMWLYDTQGEEETVRELFDEIFWSMPQEIVKKIHRYNRFFRLLASQQDIYRNQSAKLITADLLKRIGLAGTSNDKGLLLEEMVEAIIESIHGLRVLVKRRNTGDEEIDLIIENNSNSSFWKSLRSPLLFIECKYWKKRVPASAARDFEVKLQNHRPLTRIGIFVALGGFTRGFDDALKRASREDYAIVKIDLDDIKQFALTDIDSEEWLRSKLAKVH